MKVTDAIELLRPGQWIKNLLVGAGFAFALADRGQEFDWRPSLASSLAATAVFCLLSGSVYAFNDARDAAADRVHPEKRRRPVASGRVSVREALGLGAASFAIAFALACAVGGGFALCAAAYAAMQLLYNLGLKRVPWLEIAILAAGFPLRVKAGAVAAGVPVTPWILACTMSAAALVAAGKRFAEMDLGADAPRHRAVLSRYTLPGLRFAVNALAAATFAVYAAWSANPATIAKFGGHVFTYTAFPVAAGIARYAWLVLRCGEGGRPERVFSRDLRLLAWIAVWAAAWVLVLR
ncbi:MAG: UbiA prenyltransferase family protein [Kiritimatiellae bacterium]|nr:UbiA prenyltransferase family protein [Kiritimatiellia bacterium]